MLQPFITSAPHSLGDLLDVSFRFFRLKFGKLLTFSAIFVTIDLALTLVANALHNSLVTGVFNIAESIVSVFFTLALIVYIFAALAGREPAIGASISAGAGFFWSYFGMSILMGLAVGGASLPGMFIFGMGFGSLMNAEGGIGSLLAAIIGFLVLAVPIVFLMTRWMVVGQALVEEHAGATGALGRSWDLTKGLFWRCVGYFLLVGLLSILIIYLPSFVMGGLLVLVPPELRQMVQIGINIVIALLSALWTPFSLAALAVFYIDLRVRKEGLDVEMRVQQLEHEVQDTANPA